MTAVREDSDLLGQEWLFAKEWGIGAKPEAGDFGAYAKAMMICAKGDGVLAREERDYVRGNCAAFGGSPELVAELATYTADDDVVETIAQARIADASRAAVVLDAFRTCDADGDIAPGEVSAIRKMANRLGVDNVDDIHQYFLEEKALRAARIRLVYPDGPPA
ncbi:TerB family tellurite resistance protein [Longispora albida]|uniref:TerB family tellurite resistance protein n=1 Tax=Longispora albida TaxID=203523 RepID=UPI00036AF039|nr:TerB family tellurite resistance protein [Longispora albida]